MVFDKSKFVEKHDDPRYDMMTQAIKIDRDNKAYEMQFLSPNSGPGTYPIQTGAGNTTYISCYNASYANNIFDVSFTSENKINPQGTCLIIKYTAYQRRQTNAGNWLGCPVAPTAFDGTGEGWSLPWNTNHFIRDIQCLVGSSQQPLEQYAQGLNYSVGNTIRYLHDWKREALEANDMTLMPPCIESKFDDNTLSPESARRAINWLGSTGAAADNYSAAVAPKTYSKVIPLSEMLGCFQNPGIWTNCNQMRIAITFKRPEELVFLCGAAPANTANTCICIEQVQLLVDTSRTTPYQTIESAKEKVEGRIENIGYLEYACQSKINSNQIIV